MHFLVPPAIRAAACLALLAAPAAAQAPELPIRRDPSGVATRIDEHVRRLVPFGFSGSLLVASGGEVVLARGYGMADREASIPVTAETVFDIGSVTKQFTAAAILRLEMEGRLRVTDSLSRWFPGVPTDKRGITLHHLLTHTSGVRDGFGDDYAVAERDSLAGVILRSALLWTPGSRYAYSNAGYSLLAMVVEKASGMPYEQYLRARLWRPAGMTRTGYRGGRWHPHELAVGYASGGRRDGTPLEQPWATDGPWWNLRGNGGVLSTVTDLFRWHQALEGDAILSAEAKRKMYTPHVAEDERGSSHYGYGWGIHRTTRATNLVAHNGGNGIFFADFRRYVDEGVVILVMSNSADAPVREAEAAVTRMIVTGEVAPPPAAAALDSARAAALAGRYAVPGGGAVVVAADGGTVRLSPDGAGAFALLNGGTSARAQALEARTVRVVDAGARGDYGPLTEALGGQTEAQVRETYAGFMAAMAERFGAYQGTEVMGTVERDPRATAFVRMRFAGGTQLLRATWRGATLAGIEPAGGPPAAVFVPTGGDAWTSYDPATGTSTTVRFVEGALVVETPAGPVRVPRA